MEEINLIAQVPDRPNWYQLRFSDVLVHPEKFKNWRVRKDKLYYRFPDTSTDITRDGREWKYVVSEADKQQVLQESHDITQAVHMGIDKTYARKDQIYFWPGLYVDVIKYVNNCATCQSVKVSHRPLRRKRH